MDRIGSGNAPTWKPEPGDSLHGVVTDGVKLVNFTQKRKVRGKMTEEEVTRRVFELTDKETGEAWAIWESAALTELFEQVEEHGPGLVVYVCFTGYGNKKPGQNPPKLFTVGVKRPE